MKRNAKALGLALVAALAIGAVAASTAAAEGPAHFTQPGGKYPVALTGTPEGGTASNYFSFTGSGGPQSHCEDVTYEGTLEAETTTITITPHITNCVATTSIGTISSSIDMNGCELVFTAKEVTKDGAKVSAEIVCPQSEDPTHEFISVTNAFCDTHIPPQIISNGIEFTNTEEGDVTIDIDVTEEITYIETKTSIFGPCEDGHEASNGSAVSQVTVEGFEDEGTHHWTTVNPNGTEATLETLTEGAQLDIDVG